MFPQQVHPIHRTQGTNLQPQGLLVWTDHLRPPTTIFPKLHHHVSTKIVSLYPRHLCRPVYSFRLSVRPFVCSFVRSYFRHVCRICVKVLRQSFSSGGYLSNYLSESIHIWTIATLEGWHSLHDPGPLGPCPWVGLEVKI